MCHRGNNGQIVKRVLSTRAGWEETNSSNSLFAFKWVQVSRQLNFEILRDKAYRKLGNHIPAHSEITTKNRLFLNLKQLASDYKLNVFDFYPLTFVIDGTECDELRRFRTYFSQMASGNTSEYHKRGEIHPCMDDGKNMWLLKPTSCN